VPSSGLRENAPPSWDVADRVNFIHDWIGGGVAGTVDLLRHSLRPGGIMLIGEPYWRRVPPDQATVAGCDGIGAEDWLPLPELTESFGQLGCDVVEMVLADQDSWDRYVAAQ
jgi:hypothetical protein